MNTIHSRSSLSANATLLSEEDPSPVALYRGGNLDWLVVSDHASARVPAALGELGLSDADRFTHIGWDIGTQAIGRRIAQRLRCTLIECGYSRLVIDCNRYPADTASIPAVSGGVRIPGNAGLTDADRQARVDEIFRPYQQAIANELGSMQARGGLPVFISLHSCAAQWGGRTRPWGIGISWSHDARVARPLLARLGTNRELTVGDNLPYSLDLGIDFTTPEHAGRRGLAHVQVEFRQDLVETEADAIRWADIFVDALLDCESIDEWYAEDRSLQQAFLPAPSSWFVS
ncbi:N-formylglutamate amidohydrolase [Paraburkholderia agricolaris]|uniref:N-formylglutamate amidohydrolase n=1 Tax=Paraburkholderia agricolaris TaxID=2152888 RepID=UPI00142F1283|nr:N-formylglutamate amidohydrolase [Paraburkholderia agricolaris]